MFCLSRLYACAFIGLSACATTPNEPQIGGARGETAVEGNNLFAADLLTGMAQSETGNIFVSPVSLSTAMGMLQAGAAGETKAEINAVFRYPDVRLHGGLGDIRKRGSRIHEGSNPDEDPQIISIVNSLWTEKTVNLKSDYLTVLQDDYGAVPNVVDFVGNPDQAREEINDWVEVKTHDRIQDLLNKGDVSPETRLVLVNAVYMMAHWGSVFYEGNTEDRLFRVDGADAKLRPLMHNTRSYQRLKVKGGEALRLNYNNRMSMIILLPKSDKGLNPVNGILSAGTVAQVLTDIESAESVLTDLALPKFTLKARYELKPTLQSLGLTQVFDKADLSKMSDDDSLKVRDVIQQVFLEVNEKGTEAAAATAITVVTVSARLNPPKPKPFIVDRPFGMLIQDNVTGAVVFAGRITDPTTE